MALFCRTHGAILIAIEEHLDVMSQRTDTPVSVIPHPKAGYARSKALGECASVMVVS